MFNNIQSKVHHKTLSVLLMWHQGFSIWQVIYFICYQALFFSSLSVVCLSANRVLLLETFTAFYNFFLCMLSVNTRGSEKSRSN